ncbi:putative ubiquitin-like protein [Erysiphe neolycopersici]|uniref:Ubiquitin-like modifier HUB1 n=1 Tax=Erysiphe neolycopersici TaxID=212602 RepID=A0A420I2Y9_9PEZI|nr:putative ubiquitin-like protein [Erysiphe neolycopersici]
MTDNLEKRSNTSQAKKVEHSRDSKQRRSCSPSHDKGPRRSHHASSGFRWKNNRQNDRRDYTDTSENNRKRLERGYRDRSPPRRSRDQLRDTEYQTSKSKAAGTEDKYNVADKFGSSSSTRRDSRRKEVKNDQEDESPPVRPLNTAVTTVNNDEPMIVVYVNDRLGTRAAIPCLASDSIRLFKAQVAARIGRQPHEIMLKRQGERPFKNQLTLEDYGVSNGVQLDLEIDTGD